MAKKVIEIENAKLLQEKGVSEPLIEIATQTLEEVASKEGQTAQQYWDGLHAEAKTPGGYNRALDRVEQLSQMIIEKYQERLIKHSNLSEFWNSFSVGKVQGNGKQFIKHLPIAPDQYDKTEWIPTGWDLHNFKQHIIKFLEDDGTLAPNAYQDRYLAVWSPKELFTRFINGQYLEFIQNEVIGRMNDAFVMVMYHRLMEFVIDRAKATKTINGTKPNMFEAVTEELIPAIESFLLNTSEFNVDNNLSEVADASSREDVVLLCNSKVRAQLKSNIMSQLFNQGNVDLDNYVGKVHIVNNRVQLVPKQVIKFANAPYLNDTEIIVYDKRAFVKILNMNDLKGAQTFPLNISEMRVHHFWWVMGTLPWGKAFYYTNPNLTTSPKP